MAPFFTVTHVTVTPMRVIGKIGIRDNNCKYNG